MSVGGVVVLLESGAGGVVVLHERGVPGCPWGGRAVGGYRAVRIQRAPAAVLGALGG